MLRLTVLEGVLASNRGERNNVVFSFAGNGLITGVIKPAKLVGLGVKDTRFWFLILRGFGIAADSS